MAWSLASNELIEVRHTADKGEGLFATADISKGTRIIAESALIPSPLADDVWYPYDHDQEELDALMESFHRLSEEQQDAFMRLHAFPINHLHAKFENYRWESLTTDQRQVLARWRANEFGDFGVSALASKLNHDCIPNCNWVVNSETKQLTVHAIKDISAGTELTISYLPYNKDSTAKRKAHYRLIWDFDCTCLSCQDTPEARELDSKRWNLHNCSIEPYTENTEVLHWVYELHMELGLHNPSLLKAVSKLMQHYEDQEDWDKARYWSRHLIELSITCMGEDYPNVRDKFIPHDQELATKVPGRLIVQGGRLVVV